MPDWIIDDNSPSISTGGFSRGLIPRNYATHPPGYCAAAPQMPDEVLIPESEWQDRLDDQIANKTSLFDLREAANGELDSLDQDGFGYCWYFSTTKSVMYTRARMNEPFVRLSGWGACLVKNFRDEGGWGSMSVESIAAVGVPTLAMFPSPKRQYDTPEMRANMALHKISEWWDGSDSRDVNRARMVTAFLLGLAPVLDYNHISHSMCGCRLVSLNPLTVDCDNSWTMNSGNKGLMRLVGNKAIPDGIIIPRVSMPSPV